MAAAGENPPLSRVDAGKLVMKIAAVAAIAVVFAFPALPSIPTESAGVRY